MFKVNKLQSNSFFNTILSFISSQIISNFLRLVSGFIVIKYVEPDLYGNFNGISNYLSYLGLLTIGIVNGLGRELPINIALDKKFLFRKQIFTTFSFSLVVGIIGFLFFFINSISFLLSNNLDQAGVFFCFSVCALIQILSKQFFQILYRTNKDFDNLSRINFYLGIFNLISVYLVYLFSFNGLVIRFLFLNIIEFLMLYKFRPFNFRPNFSKNIFLNLLKVGFPIFLVGYIGPTFQTIINNIIFVSFGPNVFGLFSLGLVLQNGFSIIPNSLGQILYPRISVDFAKGLSISEVIRKHYKIIVIQFIIVLIIALVLYFSIPKLINFFLPKYIDGIKFAQILIFIPVIKATSIFNNIYLSFNHTKLYLLLLFGGLLLGILSIITLNYFISNSPLNYCFGLLFSVFFQQFFCFLGLIYLRKK